MIILDLETTGLDPKSDVILEIAALRVDANLETVGRPFQALVYAFPSDLARMELPVLQMHTRSGLLQACERAVASIHTVEADLLYWVGEESAPRYLAGDSIHFDRSFLREAMPRVDRALHHRMIDTSSFRVFREMLGLPVAPNPGEPPHRALQDCHASLEKLRFYREHLK